jgi:Asp-tRNA(Asn)/Glu-tRNA(Gln) amidotransferase A subunit family amidase
MRPFDLSAVALLDAYRSGALSPLEAMRDVLQRVARFEPHIHATYLLAPERALVPHAGNHAPIAPVKRPAVCPSWST